MIEYEAFLLHLPFAKPQLLRSLFALFAAFMRHFAKFR